MRIIFSGQSGIGKENVISRLVDEILNNVASPGKKSKKRIGSYKFEEFIYADPIAFRTWLDTPNQKSQEEDWENGLTRLNKELASSKPDNVFLSMHIVCYKYGRFFSPLIWEGLRKFKPDMFITLIDDVQDIWWRLRAEHTGIPANEEFSLREIIDWRCAEIMMTRSIANNLYPERQIPHYVLAVKNPASTARKLILTPDTMRIYAAYPITQARDDQGAIDEVNSHRLKMHEKFIAFDPISVDERVLISIMDDAKAKNSNTGTFKRSVSRWPVQDGFDDMSFLHESNEYPEEIVIGCDQIQEIRECIDRHIEWRDFLLLDQVHLMAAYRPGFRRRYSVGVAKEFSYSEASMIPTVTFWPDDDGDYKRPFGVRGNICNDYDTFTSHLERYQKQIQENDDRLAHTSLFV